MINPLRTIAACVLALSSTAGGTALKFASLAPEGTSWMKEMHALAEDLAQATDGRVTLKLYPGGVAGDERDVLRKIQAGQLHGAGFTGNGLGEILPAARVLDTPFLFHDIDEYDSVLATVTDTLQTLFLEKGYELGGWASVGWVYLFSKNPIGSVNDLKRARAWVWETDPLAAALFAKINISPIPLPLPQVLTSLQTGVVDAAYISPSAAVSLQWFTRVKYMTDLPLTHSTGAIVLSDRFLSKLTLADRATTVHLFRQHMRVLEPVIREEEQKSLQVLADEGITPVPVLPKEAEGFTALGAELRCEQADRLYPAWLLAMVEARLDSLRASR